MPDLLLLSSNAVLCQTLVEQLRPSAGWDVLVAAAMKAAEAALAEKAFLAVLADAAALQPQDEALRFVTQLEALSSPPFLCVIGDVDDKIAANATEVFPQPVRLGHMLARLQFYQQAQQRRSVTYDIGRWRFAPRVREMVSEETIVRLTDKEASLLEQLCQMREPMHRNDLLAAVWGYDGSMDTHTLETHIYRLRQRLPEGQDLFLVKNGAYQINPAWVG